MRTSRYALLQKTPSTASNRRAPALLTSTWSGRPASRKVSTKFRTLSKLSRSRGNVCTFAPGTRLRISSHAVLPWWSIGRQTQGRHKPGTRQTWTFQFWPASLEQQHRSTSIARFDSVSVSGRHPHRNIPGRKSPANWKQRLLTKFQVLYKCQVLYNLSFPETSQRLL